MVNLPLISIIIPCRNEEKFIGKCLDSILASNYPKDKIEVLIADGMSSDGTTEAVKAYSPKYPFIRLLHNTKKVTPVGLNMGIKKASGDYLFILSSHSKVDQNFIKANVDSMKRYDADCVGGIIVTLPANDTPIAHAIAFALSHPFGVGNSYFRIGSKKPRYVDTVPFGCYKKEIFEKIGFFDEDLIRNQDDEFNFRLMKNSGKLLLNPEIVSHYYARDSLDKLWRMFFQYGYFKPLVAKKIGSFVTWRQTIPSLFVGSLLLTGLLSFFNKYFLWLFLSIIGVYTSVNLFISFFTCIKKGLSCLPYLTVSFATLHFSYAIGYILGFFDFFIINKDIKKKIKDIPLSR